MVKLTGRRIRSIREALGLDPFALAAVLGVHVSTVYRWESLPRVEVDPLQGEILSQLEHRLADERRVAAAGKAVRNGLVAGGMLVGLAALLGFLAEPRRAGRVRPRTAQPLAGRRSGRPRGRR